MASRIIAVCNAYDTMICGRPHRKPITKEAALKELEDKKGSQFDPVIVDAFIRSAKSANPDTFSNLFGKARDN